jgi:hypothetical protein
MAMWFKAGKDGQKITKEHSSSSSSDSGNIMKHETAGLENII